MASEAQKKANRKYSKNCVNKSVKFTPEEIKDLEKIEEYLNKTGNTFSGLVKKLLKEEIEKSKNYTDKRYQFHFDTYPIMYFDEDDINWFYNNFDNNMLDMFFNELTKLFDEYFNYSNNYFEEHCDYIEWKDEIENMLESNQFKDKTSEQILQIFKSSISKYLNDTGF